jgi:hypothetical protein
MTEDELRMTKEARSPNPDIRNGGERSGPLAIAASPGSYSSFGIPSSFGIRHSSFAISPSRSIKTS